MRLKQLWIVVALVALLLLVPLPLGPALRHWYALTSTLENIGHPLVFWWLTAHLFPTLRRRFASTRMTYCLTLALAVAFAAATEYVQSIVGRDGSFEDVLNDSIGVLFALTLEARRDLRDLRLPRWRPLTTIVAAALVVIAAYPIAWTSSAYILRWQAFPLLWSPDALFGRRFSHWKQDAYPALVIDEPARDWQGYAALQIAVRSLRPEGTEIRIRVHDQNHNQEFRDRYDRAFELPDTRLRTLTIPLEAIKHGPADRELDLAAVRGIVIFQESAREPPRFAVGEIRLVR